MLISALQHKSNSISNFFEEKNQIFGSHVVVLEDLSVDVSITNVGLSQGDFFSRRMETWGTDRIQLHRYSTF